ncbi:MAG: Holliday junction ATP-dependent DNA helicase RuvB [Calditrichaeota bacterium]|nr:Holliday junction ATP-dependent DNA helicase RuvB [Calditrichota bacterium]
MNEQAKITTGAALPGEQEFDRSLRPLAFADYVGQEKLKSNLEVFVAAARQREQALDHSLFYGPPGLGKTTLAGIIAHEMGVRMHLTSGPVLEKPADLAGLLTKLEENEVLFIDEIHRLNKVVEEYLYPAMEDYRLDILIDRGPAARSVQLNLPQFTLIAATTRAGLLTAPLRNRFGITGRLDYYNHDEIQTIVERNAGKLDVKLGDGAACHIAARSRGTPRVANRLLRRLRDFAEVEGAGTLTVEIALQSLERLEIDEHGLDDMDKRILESIIDKYRGGPVGLGTLAVSIGEDTGTIEELYEPFLIQQGFLERTPRGRVATAAARELFGSGGRSGDQLRLS